MILSSDCSEPSLTPVILFILGSPRVGSTLAYQLTINHFEVYYPSNHINELFESKEFKPFELPNHIDQSQSVNYHSNYGKTQGSNQPSEASALFRYFFGGQHPSELKSKNPLPGYEKKFIQFLEHLYLTTANRKPLVFKNAWNCFRIKYLSEAFPNACFLWIRRNLADSSYSDLQARRKRGGPEVWNSATSKNYREIQELPYWEQVVEQQYSYAMRISQDLSQLAPQRYHQIWYEDLCLNSSDTIQNLKTFLMPKGFVAKNINNISKFEKSNPLDKSKNKSDFDKILQYSNSKKFDELRYEGKLIN